MESKKSNVAVLVDGENIDKFNMMIFNDEFGPNAIRLYFTSNDVEETTFEGTWLDFEIKVTPRREGGMPVGKEAVDRMVAMNMVSLYFEGVRDFYLVSNDMDFGCTASYFKREYPDAKVTIILNPRITSRQYVNFLKSDGIGYRFFSNKNVENLAMDILTLLHRHIKGHFVPLPQVAQVLRKHGFPLRKGRVAKDLKKMGFKVNGNHLVLPENGVENKKSSRHGLKF